MSEGILRKVDFKSGRKDECVCGMEEWFYGVFVMLFNEWNSVKSRR